jgi:hypothetical protein
MLLLTFPWIAGPLPRQGFEDILEVKALARTKGRIAAIP